MSGCRLDRKRVIMLFIEVASHCLNSLTLREEMKEKSIPSTKTIQVCTSNYPPHMHAMKLYLSNVPGLHVTSEPPQANSYIRYQET